MQRTLPEIKELGGQLIAVSPQLPDNSLSTAEKLAIEFEVLSDVGNQVAKEFGLVFSLPEILRPVYKNFGFDLEAANGDSSFELPVPATYVMNQEGVIQFDFVDVDYTKRAEPDEIVTVLRRLSQH